MQVDVKVNPCVEDVEVLITAEKKTQFVNDLVEIIWDFDKHTVTTLTGYIDNRAYIIKVADILRIFALNQKVYIQTANAEFLISKRQLQQRSRQKGTATQERWLFPFSCKRRVTAKKDGEKTPREANPHWAP